MPGLDLRPAVRRIGSHAIALLRRLSARPADPQPQASAAVEPDDGVVRGPVDHMGVQDRSDYKTTWTTLAQTSADAANSVAGYEAEHELELTANHTVDVLRRFVGIEPSDDILEIGCGIGRVGKVLAPQCRTWTGADISPGMLAIAAGRTAAHPNVRLVELHAVGLSEFEDASFDVVYCTVVFMHLFEWDRYRYVQEARRVLRPGGRCFFDNVDITSGHGKEFFALSAAHPIEARPPHIGMVSSGDELRSYATWAGFESVEIHRWDDAWVGVTGVNPG